MPGRSCRLGWAGCNTSNVDPHAIAIREPLNYAQFIDRREVDVDFWDACLVIYRRGTQEAKHSDDRDSEGEERIQSVSH